MSYLHTPHFVFSGDFYANTATVNNDVRHYDNSAFEEVYQDPQTGKPLLGWWNPNGGNQFNLQNCTVQSVAMPNGQQSSDPTFDNIIGQMVGAPDNKGTGKMLDLDPQWQMSSELWCVQIKIYTAQNELLLSGDMTVSGFRDLQLRQTDGGAENGQPMGGTWTSTLTNLVWGPQAANSNCLKALQGATQNNTLAINLNMYGFYYAHNNGRFSLGRIIGTIGPWYNTEPNTIPAARRLYGTNGDGNNTPIYFNYSNFIVDKTNSRVAVDLGASFPIDDSMGTISSNSAKYLLGISNTALNNDPSGTPVFIQPMNFVQIGPINYTAGNADWLNTTGGIVMMDLSSDLLTQIANNQLILLQEVNNQYQLIARESVQGFSLRADNLVQRLDNGDSGSVVMYAWQWGQPAPNVNVTVSIQPPTQALFAPQQTGDDTQKVTVPYINTPTSGLTIGTIAPTSTGGVTTVPLTGNALSNPRVYVEGQVYYLSYQTDAFPADNAAYGMDAIYVHVRDAYTVPDAPTWDDVSEIFNQFGNLYPLMSKYVVDLNSETSVSQRTSILIYAFTRDINDTFYMPVTRDISEAKRQTIVKWLQNPLPGGTTERARKSIAPEAQPQAASGTLDETDEMKKVKQLTLKKNGAEFLKKQ